ncbi:MAG: hypothetical protein SGJ00_05155 [bacterium]|nr:hypothetical protein [bacterium]
MNKLLLLVILLPLCVQAQLKKGRYYLQASMSLQTSGNLSVNAANSSGNVSSNLPLSQVGLGKFVSNKQSVNLFVLGSLGTSDILGQAKSYTLGVGLGYNFFHPMSDQWGLFLGNELSFRKGQSANNKNISNADEYLQKINIVNAKVSPGIYYLFFDKLWVQASIDWVTFSYIDLQNNPNIPLTNRQQASKNVSFSGLLPGTIQLANIQFRLSYLFP